ncbi:MAG: hypothetical protein KZQ70_15600 [gamma proteobacterium symbiont of Lucinoma myriamae]|nr:hypothetical protein [gamma proteobacterium symbiont of Lucinoma myriamae]
MTQIVQKITNKIHSPDFIEQHRQSEKDFTRNRSLTFPRLISFMLNMVNGSIQNERKRQLKPTFTISFSQVRL